MHIKRMHEMIEKLVECTENAIDSNETCVGAYPISDVVDMIKDLNEAEYHAVIVKAMKESEEEEKEYEKRLMDLLKNEYGEEDGRRFYDRYRYANGRFAPKGKGMRMGYEEPPYLRMTPEMYRDMEHDRDMDRYTHQRMFYSEPSMAAHESEYDIAKREYHNAKRDHNGSSQSEKDAVMKSFEKYLKEVAKDLTGLYDDMLPEEKSLAKNSLNALASKM